MVSATDLTDPDAATEVAALMADCRSAVEAANLEARRLHEMRRGPSGGDIGRLALLVEDAAYAFDMLHRAMGQLQGRAAELQAGDLEEIGAAVMRAHLATGRAIREDHLARLLGRDLAVVQEAALLLVSRGVAERDGGGGIRPAPFSQGDLGQLFELREALEPFACEQAAILMSPAERQALAEAVETDADLAHDAIHDAACRTLFRKDHFSCRIIRASRNAPLIELLVDTIHYRLWLNSRFFSPLPGSGEAARAEQRRIAAALLAADPAAAGAEMRRYIANSLARTRWLGRPSPYANVEDLGAHRRARHHFPRQLR